MARDEAPPDAAAESDEVPVEETDGDEPAPPTTDEEGRREVELPLRLYKSVIVFSTLIAVASVVVGFLLLDAATLGGSLLRRVVAAGFAAVGIVLAEGTLSALFAVAGLLTIAFGALVYVMGTRFRAPGMTGGRDEE